MPNNSNDGAITERAIERGTGMDTFLTMRNCVRRVGDMNRRPNSRGNEDTATIHQTDNEMETVDELTTDMKGMIRRKDAMVSAT